MIRKFCLLGLSFAALMLPQTIYAQSVTLEPGLYSYSNVINIGGSAMPDDKGEYCVKAGENHKSLDDIVESLSGGANCTLSNVFMTETNGRADLLCTDTSLGMDIRGKLEAEFSSNSYDVDTTATLGGFLPLQTKTRIRRIGICQSESLNLNKSNPT